MAPLAVFFDATATTATAAPTRPFHDLEYRWDFDNTNQDASDPSWSTTGLPKERAKGPVAGHVYETPGTYTVCLTVLDGTNLSQTSATITVLDPDTAYAGANTVCIGNAQATAGVDGCPSGAATPAGTADFDAAVNAHKGANKRILFRRGDTFQSNTEAIINVTGPATIGAFGSGAKPLVQLTTNGIAFIQLSSSGSPGIADWRIMDLDFDGGNRSGSVGVDTQGSINQVTMLRMTIRNINNGVRLNEFVLPFLSAAHHQMYDQMALVDSTISHAIGGTGGYLTFLSARRLSYLGNNVDDAISGEHVLRTPYLGKAVISNNALSRPAAEKHTIKMHAPSRSGPDLNAPNVLHSANDFTEQVVVSDNLITGGNSGHDWTVALGPEDSANDERLRDIIVERNWFLNSSAPFPVITSGGFANTTQQIALHIAAQEVTIRNNLFNLTGAFIHNGVFVTQRGIEPASNQVRIYHNTFYSADTDNDFEAVALDSMVTNVSVRNNLARAPSDSSHVMLSGTGASGLVASDNSTNAQVQTADPLFSTATPGVSSLPAAFKLQSGSYAIGSLTAVPVHSDFEGEDRPKATTFDRGMDEF